MCSSSVRCRRFLPTTSATTLGTLIDQRTGTSRQAPNPICSRGVALSNRAIATDCRQLDGPNAGLHAKIYDIASGRWSSTISKVTSCGCSPVLAGIGDDWITWAGECYHGPGFLMFENIRTGQLLADPTAVHTVPDVDAAQLAQPVCHPLSVPPDWQQPYDFIQTSGTLQPAGRYVFALGATLNRHSDTIVPFASRERRAWCDLARCHVALLRPTLPADARAITGAWETRYRRDACARTAQEAAGGQPPSGERPRCRGE